MTAESDRWDDSDAIVSAELVESEPQQKQGCFSIVLYCSLVAICVVLVLASIAVGGGLGYLVAYIFGAPSIPSYIGGTVAAFLSVCLSMPSGMMGFFLFSPQDAQPLSRSLAALVVGILTPLIQSIAILQIAALLSVGGGVLYHFHEPLWAAIYSAVVFPSLGVIFGIASANPNRE